MYVKYKMDKVVDFIRRCQFLDILYIPLEDVKFGYRSSEAAILMATVIHRYLFILLKIHH